MSVADVPEGHVRRVWRRCVRFMEDSDFPELQTWRGSLWLLGAWLLSLVVLLLALACAPLRLFLRPGGWRFLTVLLLAVIVCGAVFIGYLALAFSLGLRGIH